jgi:voltage-gated potassium channel
MLKASTNTKTRWRATVYWWLERPNRNTAGPRLLEVVLISLISANVIAVVLETIDPLYQAWRSAFDTFELFSLAVFSVEYLARLWVVPEHGTYRSRLAWAVTPSAVIDLLAVIPALLVLLIPIDLRVLRIFRILRLLKLTRYSPALGMLLAVFEEEAGAFFACFFILVIMLIIAASGAWLVEHKAQPEDFGSIPAAMWWAVATLTTVGYGDVTPVTVLGKVFASMITVVGIGMAAMPAGIIASGLNSQLRRRRESLEREFRKALLDGNLCEKDEADIDNLRRELGLSTRVADSVRQEMVAKLHAPKGFCQTCGQRLPEESLKE